MKLVAFESTATPGHAEWGIAAAPGWVRPPHDVAARLPDAGAVLAAGDFAAREADILRRGTPVARGTVRALPVVRRPGKIVCVGLNYRSHVAETKREDSDYPALFTRFADTLAADGDTLERPAFSERFDFEGELAIVIGRAGRAIPRSRALDHIGGYACFNDVTVRDWQRHTHQWLPGKNFPATGPLGPWLVTADEVPDVTRLAIETRLNGTVMQRASLADLIFTLPVLVEYVSRFTPLAPGDVIATGTPGGVGDRRTPPVYLRDGDVVEVEITGLGVLRNPVGTAT